MILLQDLIGTASPIELAWLMVAGLGIYLAAWNGSEALEDYRALNGKKNGRRRIAIGTIRREVIRVAANVVLGFVGVLAANIPANPNATTLGLAVSLILLLGFAAFNVNSAFDRADRVYLMRFGLQPRDESGRFTKE